ncbi:MAG TPA: tyrosine-type recombinase/integrase [Aggregatilinea sp.]|uniref:tyrosine-type recombinase/integrase n=1 Tax=Aggregatilinea sp. TaxID=2806333 RepID=UPI002CA19142|nr:tyrosine-type recombinase/integrase [Aggregatilinea sp.]HML20943.1 tyrosine-type recombinase/integrase [Aggregatilinea sp.]
MTEQNALLPTPVEPDSSELIHAGQAANYHAAQNAFTDYLSRKATNTIRRQRADLDRFREYLLAAGLSPHDLQHDPDAWRGLTWGIVEGFVKWMVAQGDAMGSINVRLSTVKTYAKLAAKAGAIEAQELALIRTVAGYSQKESRRMDGRREVTRRGEKKAQAVHIEQEQAQRLKAQPDTPQGRRDRLLMCLLIDHGLRVGEVAALEVTSFDLQAGEMRFYRAKVDQTQTHKLSADTLRAVQAWIASGDAPTTGKLLRASRKGGTLTGTGMSERGITKRVKELGEQIGLEGLSAHDCRHYWATFWATKVDVLRLQEAGGWSSLAMPRRYVEAAKIANEGMA